MATEVYEDHGVRFEYPSDWTVEVTDEDDVTTVDLQHPEGVAFVLVRIDESCPDPEETADLALEAMREEYPELDASPVMETLGEHIVTGHDVEFFSLDVSQRGHHSLLPHAASHGARFRPVVGSGRRRDAPSLSAACSGRWRSWRIDCVNFSFACLDPRARRAPLAASSRNAAIRSRSSSPPLSTTSVWRASGTSIQWGAAGKASARRRASSIETTVSLVPWRIKVGQVTCRAESMGARGVDRHARQLAGPARDQPGHELRKGYLPPAQYDGHRHDEVDHGRFEHNRREARFGGGCPHGDARSHRAAPQHGLKGHVRVDPGDPLREEFQPRSGCPPPHGRRMSDKVHRSGHNLANRAPPRSSRAGSRPRRVEPRAPTRLRQTREGGARSVP